MEDLYGSYIPKGQAKGRDAFNVFFRKRRSTKDIIKEASTKTFEKFKPNHNYQLTMFCDIDEDFSCEECGTIF